MNSKHELVSCDICGRQTLRYVDGATRLGCWANMCPSCFPRYGYGLGVGRGQAYLYDETAQRYVRQAGGRG